MDKLKQWVALTVVAVLVIVVGSWFLLISPKRSEASDIRSQTTAQEGANRILTGQISMLKAQAKSLPQKQAKLAAVAAKIPDNPALPTLIRALTAAADDAGVELISMSPAQPVPVADPAAAGAVAPKAGAKTTSSSSSAAAPAASSAAGSLQSIQVSLSVAGGYFQIEQFFDRLENLSRAMKVSSVAMTPGSNPIKVVPAGQTADVLDNTLMGTVTASVFMATGRSAAAASGK